MFYLVGLSVHLYPIKIKRRITTELIRPNPREGLVPVLSTSVYPN